MTLAQNVREMLGRQFDVAFHVDQEFHNHEPVLTVTPEENHDDYFSVEMEFKNRNRLVLSFLPQKYSANMIRSMGHAIQEKKTQFCSFGKLISLANASVNFLLNDLAASITDFDAWPSEWNKVNLRISIAPIERTQEDTVDYLGTLQKYVPAFMGMILSLLDIVPLDKSIGVGYQEGTVKNVVSRRYERNPINRAICIQKHGCSCQICGMNFQRVYGEIGEGFIHVHHTIPVSQMGEHYVVDPIRELIPVCPNCHAMLHRTNPPITPEELKKLLVSQK